MQTSANPKLIGYTGSLRPSCDESGELWFTPLDFVESVRRSLGGIDLDPFSCAEANVGIKAMRYFDRKNSAFHQAWPATSVFMNPPYGRGLCAKACGKFIDEWRARSFNRGVILVNNMTDTTWFHDLLQHCRALCLIKGRIQFTTPDHKRSSSNTRGQISLLFCRNGSQYEGLFRKEMSGWGHVFVNPVRLSGGNGYGS